MTKAIRADFSRSAEPSFSASRKQALLPLPMKTAPHGGRTLPLDPDEL